MIDDICFVPEVGKLYYGKVVRILPIGAFVELAPGKDGMIHISKLENHRVEKVEDVLNVGDMTWVKVTEIDEKGRVNLSRKDALKELAAQTAVCGLFCIYGTIRTYAPPSIRRRSCRTTGEGAGRMQQPFWYRRPDAGGKNRSRRVRCMASCRSSAAANSPRSSAKQRINASTCFMQYFLSYKYVV